MVTDGAETSLNILLNINSIWCIAHIFNLVIKDVLFNKQKNSEKFEDEEYFLEELTEIRNFITSIRKSTVYSKILYKIQLDDIENRKKRFGKIRKQ